MKTRAAIAAELRLALRSIEMTETLLAVVRTGAVSLEDLVRYLDDALGAALDQAFLDFAERIGDVPSLRQVSAAERAVLFRDMAEGSLDLVQDVAERYRPTWSDARLERELKRAVLMNAKDAKAAKNYDAELKSGDPKAKKRKLRDKRFSARTKPSLAKRRLMVDRYRDRLIAARTAGIARDEARAIEAGTDFAHWSDRAAAGDPEAQDVRKFWINREDGKVRDAHVYVVEDYPDGLPLNEPFVTRWGNMRYPHDSQGDIRNRRGCRCRFRIGKART